jgi:hypothetical protein
MQQLFITILAMLSVIAPIAAEKMGGMLITQRLRMRFQHFFLMALPVKAAAVELTPTNAVWQKLLAYQRSDDSIARRLRAEPGSRPSCLD